MMTLRSLSWLRRLPAMLVVAMLRCLFGEDSSLEFQPNQTVQQALIELYPLNSQEDLHSKARRLEALSGGRDRLMRDLVWFGSRTADTRGGMVPAVVVNTLAISDREIVSALVTILGARDDGFRKEAEQLVRDLEPGLRQCRGTFEILGDFIRSGDQQTAEPPLPLVQFIFRTHPANALRAMTSEFLRDSPAQTRELIWAEHVVADAIWKKENQFTDALAEVGRDVAEQLDALAKHRQWWVRLYAAEVLRRHPELGEPETIKQLRQDAHELVREAVSGSGNRSN